MSNAKATFHYSLTLRESCVIFKEIVVQRLRKYWCYPIFSSVILQMHVGGRAL